MRYRCYRCHQSDENMPVTDAMRVKMATVLPRRHVLPTNGFADGDSAPVTERVCVLTNRHLLPNDRVSMTRDPDCYRKLQCLFEGSNSMALEERVLRACQGCAMRHIADIDAAMVAVKRELKIPKLPSWILDLVDNALREQIHFARHVSNRKLRKDNGGYGGPGKVGASSALDDVAESIYQKSVFEHTILGWLLGDIEKSELISFAEIEDNKAAGSMFNASLCRACYQACAKRKGGTVRECLKESEVEAMFKKIAKQLGREAA